MKWTTEYPKSEGWYWIAVFENYSYTNIQYFYPNEETGEFYSSDEQFYEYGRDHYEGYLFAGPLEEPKL